MSLVFGGICLSLSRRSTPWGWWRRGSPRRWWRWWCLRLRQWSWWTRRRRWRRRSGRQWYRPHVSLTLVRPQWCWLPLGSQRRHPQFQRGLYPPALGQSSVRDRCLALDPALVSMDPPPGGPPVESLLAVEFLCFSSPSWVSVAWGLSLVLASSPALPSWVSSRAAVPWIHPLHHQAPGAERFFRRGTRSSSLSGSSSCVVSSSGGIMRLRITILRPLSSSIGSSSESPSSLYGSMAVWRLKPCFCQKLSINSSIIWSVQFSTD